MNDKDLKQVQHLIAEHTDHLLKMIQSLTDRIAVLEEREEKTVLNLTHSDTVFMADPINRPMRRRSR